MNNEINSKTELCRHEQLVKEGWSRRFIYDEPRLTEAKELYESMGLEVRLEPVIPDELEDGCDTCITAAPDRYRIIYTRPR
jgi:hypothetical protein